MSKILVTGANGYIGYHVVNKLLERNHEVIATDFAFTRDKNKKVKYIECSLFEIDNPYSFFCKPDICIHLAWSDGFNHNSSSHIKNLPLHYEFLVKLIDSGIKGLAVMGTMHEIGYYEGIVNENTPCNPQSLYGISKNTLRQLLFLENKIKKFDLYWLRAFYIYGDDKSNKSIFSKVLEAARKGEKIFPFNSGKNKYDFIQIDDLAESISMVCSQSKVTGIINCCSGKPISLSDKVNEFINQNNLNIKLKYGMYPDRPYDSPAIWGDTSKIELIKKQEL